MKITHGKQKKASFLLRTAVMLNRMILLLIANLCENYSQTRRAWCRNLTVWVVNNGAGV